MTRNDEADMRTRDLKFRGKAEGAENSSTENLDTLMAQSSANCSPEMKRFLNAVGNSLAEIDAEASGQPVSESREAMMGDYRK